MPVEIDRAGAGRWRYTCPRGHIRWYRREESFWCVPCDRTPAYDSGRYYRLIEQKTRTELPFEPDGPHGEHCLACSSRSVGRRYKQTTLALVSCVKYGGKVLEKLPW